MYQTIQFKTTVPNELIGHLPLVRVVLLIPLLLACFCPFANGGGGLKPAPDGMRFDMRVQRSGDVVAQPELLLVVAGPQTLQALRVVNGAMANQVFAPALEELRRTGQVIGATVQYFKVGG